MTRIAEKREVKRVWRRRMNDGLGKKFRVSVTLNETDYLIDGEWKRGFTSPAEWHKVEEAIEKKYPGWFHTCHKSPKQHCKACTRKKAVQLLKRQQAAN